MGMVIKNNIDSVRTYNIYNRNTIALSNSMYKVSSGQRINTAADGASDLAISEKLRTRIRSVDQANRNTQNGVNMVKTANGALGNINDMLSTVRERLVNFANDTNGLSERKYIVSEVGALLSNIDDIAKNTSFNNVKLLDGTWASDDNTEGLFFQTGADNASTTTVSIAKMDLDGLSLSSLAEDLDGQAINSANDGAVATAVGGFIDTVDTAIGRVLGAMTDLGATENKLGYTADNLAIESENLQASESTIRDMDIAKGMTEFAKNNILTQASQFMLAQASQNPYSVLNLLQQQ